MMDTYTGGGITAYGRSYGLADNESDPLVTESGHVAPTLRLCHPGAHAEARARDGRRGVKAVPCVLHIDRDVDAALMLATLLMPETQVTHVFTLEAALRALGEQHFSLVVLDPELPDGDGRAVFEVLQRAGTATPLLVYAERNVAWGERAGAFLFKPWTAPRQLWDQVARLLSLAPANAAGRRP